MRGAAKRVLGRVPLSAEFWQWIHPATSEIAGGYRVDRLEEALADWIAAAVAARRTIKLDRPKRVLMISSLSWWLEYATAMGLLLAGMGHTVELAFLPYRRWTERVGRFDLRRQRAYLRQVLSLTKSLFRIHDMAVTPRCDLPTELARSMQAQSHLDVQYTLQREDLDLGQSSEDFDLYCLRLERNMAAARVAYDLLRCRRYDVILVPNGSILEFGAVYRVARHLCVPVVTYEFGEQRERMWLAQNNEIMLQDTTELWQARGCEPLTKAENDTLLALYQARRGGKLYSNFTRQWQAQEGKGAQAAQQELDLDPDRPIALLCTNVVGDSLSLGRELFTNGMADWVTRTVRHFAGHPETQLVVRVHPGELLGAGHPSIEIVHAALPELPSHVVVVPPDSKINTYDLVELAHLGLVYTTTIGLEMAMSGVAVVVAGNAHYRGKGFTHDPRSFEEYLAQVDRLLTNPFGQRLPRTQVELAWRYAYRFFFEFSFLFPWHLLSFWDDLAARPLEEVVQPSGRAPYLGTIEALLGEPIDWSRNAARLKVGIEFE